VVVTGLASNEVTIPKGVTVELKGDVVNMSGKLGKTSKKFEFGRSLAVVNGSTITITVKLPKKNELAEINTIASELRSMAEGVTTGFEYKLRIVYAHFPIKVQVKGQEVIIENFLGERHPRKAKIAGNAKVAIAGDQITVTSTVIEDAGQTAANIERATRIKNYDKRVFQDGIYIKSKAGRVLT
jgi:large subunit ribosomal protein L6